MDFGAFCAELRHCTAAEEYESQCRLIRWGNWEITSVSSWHANTQEKATLKNKKH